MTAVLSQGNRRFAGATAPAAGLYLWRVEYPPAFGIPAPDLRAFDAVNGPIGLD
jgi:tRNA U38,U39,U40 pseudouridine synthase TruA